MSYDTDRYGLKKLPGQSLAVIECGIQICHPGHATPRMTYNSYSVHFILEGRGTYTVKGRTYELCAGQGFMITPGIPNAYTADSREPWKYVYASFCGTDDDVLVHHAGLDEDNVVFSFPLDRDMIRDIYAMHAAGKKNEAKGYDVTGYFLLCMSRLVRANASDGEKAGVPEQYVRKAVRYMEDHFSDSISVNDIAFHMGLDRSYLYRIFKRHMGYPPSRYLLNYRLERAAEMLENPTLAIAEIATGVGFHDSAHFYKAFTAKYGMTPGNYRNSRPESAG